MTPTCKCEHSKTDHLTGRCVHRQMRLDRKTGNVVNTLCRCKKFVIAGNGKAAEPVLPVAEEAADPSTESDGTAPAELATESAPATETPVAAEE